MSEEMNPLTRDHGQCPHCHTDLNGRHIYEVMLEQTKGDEAKALEWAESYGATKEEGRFGREVSIYANDMTVGWGCPDCGHTWDRFKDPRLTVALARPPRLLGFRTTG